MGKRSQIAHIALAVRVFGFLMKDLARASMPHQPILALAELFFLLPLIIGNGPIQQ